MITGTFDGVHLTTEASVCFDGRCVSRSFTLPSDTRKFVSTVLLVTLIFDAAATEIMECVGSSCRYKLDGTDEWKTSGAGDDFQVPANSKFDIRVIKAYHYICHYA